MVYVFLVIFCCPRGCIVKALSRNSSNWNFSQNSDNGLSVVLTLTPYNCDFIRVIYFALSYLVDGYLLFIWWRRIWTRDLERFVVWQKWTLDERAPESIHSFISANMFSASSIIHGFKGPLNHSWKQICKDHFVCVWECMLNDHMLQHLIVVTLE